MNGLKAFLDFSLDLDAEAQMKRGGHFMKHIFVHIQTYFII